MITYPKAKVTVHTDRRSPSGSTARATAHTSETPSSAFYTRVAYYTFQCREYGGIVYWRQFLDPEDISHALRRPDSRQTNGEGKINFSLAVMGYARNMPQMSDLLVKEIAEFMIWADKALGVKATFGLYGSGGSECYGVNSQCRMSWDRWKTLEGWCGHQNVPGNTHWDPNFPTARIHSAITSLEAGYAVPGEPGLKDGQIMMEIQLETLRLYSGYASKGKEHQREDVKTCQALLLKEGFEDKNTTDPRNYADGFFGPGTERAVKNFQGAQGLAIDGVVGAATWDALLAQ